MFLIGYHHYKTNVICAPKNERRVQFIFPSMSGKLDVKVVSYIHTYEWFLYNSI